MVQDDCHPFTLATVKSCCSDINAGFPSCVDGLARIEPYKEQMNHVITGWSGGGATRRHAALAQPPSP